MWPRSLVLPHGLVTISPYSLESIGGSSGNLGVPTSWVWPAANKAIFVPFRISRPILVLNMFVWNGAAVNGNLDIGIYDHTGTKLVSSGSVAQVGIDTLQTVNIADTIIGPGLFYMALAFDNIIATTRTSRPPRAASRALGLADMAAAFPLPATAIFAQIVGSSYAIVHGLTARSIV